jgi:hypothetical protein
MRELLGCLVLLNSLAATPKADADDPLQMKKEDLAASAKKLKQIGLAFHAYHNAVGALPGDIQSKDGKPLLSWRVAILPYIEQDNLFKQFKLNESWDSEHNKKLLARMPSLYSQVRVEAREWETFYQSFYGPKTIFDPKRKPLTLAQISNANGTSNTVLVVEAGVPTVWTKPHDLPLNPKKPLPKLGGMFNGDFHVLLCDGAVRFLKKTTNENELKKAIDPFNDEPFNLNKHER